MKILIIINDPPYGTERAYNALRLALSLSKEDYVELKVFLMGDSILCAKAGQNTPAGYYNIERMIKGLTVKDIPVGACGSCMDARGIQESDLAAKVHKSSLEELTKWTLEAEKILIF
ncbi:MAG: DsrE family protein [Firmicutes bacterium]|nr:DsrE family protein [Bacillota bacterium]